MIGKNETGCKLTARTGLEEEGCGFLESLQALRYVRLAAEHLSNTAEHCRTSVKHCGTLENTWGNNDALRDTNGLAFHSLSHFIKLRIKFRIKLDMKRDQA